MHTVQDILALA